MPDKDMQLSVNTPVKITLSLLMLVCCSDDEHPIPNYQVYISFNLNDTKYLDFGNGKTHTFTQVNGVNITSVGYGGVIVYRENMDNLHAYDMACPYDGITSNEARLTPSNLWASCPVCSSKFHLYTGSPTEESVATFPLKRYQVRISNSSVLITN